MSEVEELLKRLEEKVDSGRRTIGGASISADGKGSMWGGEPIMVYRNPDGLAAAALLRTQQQRIEELEKQKVNLFYTRLKRCDL